MKTLQNIIALLHLFITYLSTTYFIWSMARYTMRQARVLSKVTRSTKLQGAQCSPELGLKSTNFRAPENLIFLALISMRIYHNLKLIRIWPEKLLWGLIPTFVGVAGGKTGRGPFCPPLPPPILDIIFIWIRIYKETFKSALM